VCVYSRQDRLGLGLRYGVVVVKVDKLVCKYVRLYRIL